MANGTDKHGDEPKSDAVRRLVASTVLSPSEYNALLHLDPLIKECETDSQFKRELAHDIEQRGAIIVRMEFRSKIVKRAFCLMELGAPECNASPNRVMGNISVHFVKAAIEQSNGEK